MGSYIIGASGLKASTDFQKKENGTTWNFASYPIIGYDKSKPWDSPQNTKALNNGLIHTTGWDYIPGWYGTPWQNIYYIIKYRQEQKKNKP